MARNTFDNLPLSEKAILIDEYGVHLTSIEYYDYRIDLFAMHSLLIERYQKIETDEVESIHTCHYRDLDKYASQIVIGKLRQELKC